MVGRQHVVKHRHAGKQADVLEGAGHAQLGDLVRALAGDVLAQERDPALGGLVHAGHHVEGGGLARAVGTDQGHDLALVDVHRQVVHGDDAAEAHGQMVDMQHVFTHLACAPFLFFLPIPRIRSGSSFVPMMPWRKNSTTIMMMMENTTSLKPLRSSGTSKVPMVCF